MNTNLKNLFVDFINEGAKAASLIAESDKKANAYAALANAIAKSGLLVDSNTIAKAGLLTDSNVVEEKEEVTGKESLKKETAKKTRKSKAKTKPAINEEDIPAEQEAAPIPQETAQSEEAVQPAEEVVNAEETSVEEVKETEEAPVSPEEVEQENVEEDTWNDKTIAENQEMYDQFRWFYENWGEEYLNYYAQSWFEDQNASVADIRPSNVNGFVSYLYEIANQQQEEQ